MREVAVVNLKSDAAKGLRGWLRFRKRLPEIFGSFDRGVRLLILSGKQARSTWTLRDGQS